jgi:hypothetical protein
MAGEDRSTGPSTRRVRTHENYNDNYKNRYKVVGQIMWCYKTQPLQYLL